MHCFTTLIWEWGHCMVFSDAGIVTVFQNGDKSDCGNDREVGLPAPTGQIFFNYLLPVTENWLLLRTNVKLLNL